MVVLLGVLCLLFQVGTQQAIQDLYGSDSLIVKNWTVQDGLPVNTVNSVVQDNNGFIWLTTYDGIVRFDGINFEVYNHSNTPEIPQNRAVFLYLQEQNGLWVTLENGGVLLIKDNEFHHFDEDDGFTSLNTTYLVEDSKGRMWFATFNGLYKFENGEFTKAFERETQDQNKITFIYEDWDGSIFAATGDGLVHIKNDKIQVYDVEPKTDKNQFQRIRRGKDGELLVGSMQGLYALGEDGLYIPSKFKELKTEAVPYLYADDETYLISSAKALYRYDGKLNKLKDYIDNKLYWRFFRDSKNILWSINTRGELAHIEGDEVITLTDNAPFSGFYYNQIAEDREHNIWFATARDGIIRLKKSRIKTIGSKEGLSGNNILGLFEDSKGQFWIGTRDYGLNKISQSGVEWVDLEANDSKGIIHSINEDKEGNIWIGYYQHGVDKLSEDGITSYDLGFEDGINDVRSVFVRADSSIWLGTYGGLIHLDEYDESHKIYTKADGLAGNLVRYLDEDNDGGLWVATMDGGVSYFKDGYFTNYSAKDGLSSDNIRSVYVDEHEEGTVWIGTENNGLNRIRNGEIKTLSVENGLPDHVIHYISQDSYGWLWMSSNRGIFKILKHELNSYLDGESEHFSMIHYDKEQGMRNPEANGSFQEGGLRTSNQTFWFATQEGVAIIDVRDKEINEVEPIPLIQNVFANGEYFYDSKITLSSGIKGFQVDFHALTFSAPKKTRFRYTLDGYEDKWHELLNERSVSYSNLPAGDYTFRVIAANSDGIWSSDQATVDIKIQPLFYEQVWFYALILIFVVLAYLSISRLRYRYLIYQQENLKSIIEEQTAEIRREKHELEEKNAIIERQAEKLAESNSTKDKFMSLIAHDLRGPFQAILGFSDFLLKDFENTDRKEIEKGLQIIKSSSKSLYDLVENLLSWASLQTGKIKVHPEQLNLNNIVKHNVELFSQVAEQKDITINCTFTEQVQLYADKNQIDTILRNLISNAIKFTKTGGNVWVKLHRSKDTCSIEIKDNGIGMSEEVLNELKQIDSNSSRRGTKDEKGTGLGLLICNEMIALHKGKLEISSEENVGTTFTVILPLQKESAKEQKEEINA